MAGFAAQAHFALIAGGLAIDDTLTRDAAAPFRRHGDWHSRVSLHLFHDGRRTPLGDDFSDTAAMLSMIIRRLPHDVRASISARFPYGRCRHGRLHGACAMIARRFISARYRDGGDGVTTTASRQDFISCELLNTPVILFYFHFAAPFEAAEPR